MKFIREDAHPSERNKGMVDANEGQDQDKDADLCINSDTSVAGEPEWGEDWKPSGEEQQAKPESQQTTATPIIVRLLQNTDSPLTSYERETLLIQKESVIVARGTKFVAVLALIAAAIAAFFVWAQWQELNHQTIISASVLEKAISDSMASDLAIKRQLDTSQTQALAATSAANTAAAVLKSSKETFRIDQRPWIVVETPEFVQLPEVGKIASANFQRKNVGKTPAINEVLFGNLVRFHPPPRSAGEAARRKVLDFLESAFDGLHRQAAAREQEYIALKFSRADVAPGGSRFSTLRDSITMSDHDVSDLKTGALMLVYIAVITYTDAFSGHYETQVCNYYFGSEPKVWHVCDSHNTFK